MSVRRGAFVLIALGAAFLAVAAIARSERVYSAADVRGAFVAAGVPVVPAEAFLPGCRPPWVRYSRAIMAPRQPTIECVEAIFIVRSTPSVSVYVFPSPAFVAPFLDRRSELPYFIVARSNVLVFAERPHSAVDVALGGLD